MRSSKINIVLNVDCDNIDDLRGIDGKFHYFYKIINSINNKFYYGVHSTKNIYDYYDGSGSAIRQAYKKYGKKNFTKYILEFFDDRKSLMEYEEYVVNENLVNNHNCYNLILGGIGSYELGTHNSEYLLHTTLGLIHINNGVKNKLIKPSELKIYLSNGWIKGQLHKSCANKILIHNSNMDELFIYPEEFESYEKCGWVRGGKSRNKGQISFAKNCVWINDGKMCKRINKNELQQYLNNGWKTGAIQKYSKGYIRITNGVEDRHIPPENTEELQYYFDNGWYKGSHAKHKGGVGIHNKEKDKVVKREELQQYLNDGWELGRLYKPNPENTIKGRIYIYKGDVIKTIKKEELQQYLNDGWKEGNPKNRRPSSNKDKIRINNGEVTKTIKKEELHQYLDDGWCLGNVGKSIMKGRIRVTNGIEERLINLEEFEDYKEKGWHRGLLKPRKLKD